MNSAERFKELWKIWDVDDDPLTGAQLDELFRIAKSGISLLAAAEANDGSTPETDACADWNARCERVGDNEIITHGLMLALAHDEGDELRLLARRLERERNGLAARVAELEQFQLERQSAEYLDAERYRYLRDRADENSDGPIICSGLGDNFDFLRGPECDEEIDAARSK